MSYAALHSPEAREAMARALEQPAIARVAAGRMSVDDLLGMQEASINAAFQLIRWPDTSGEPVCPRCAGRRAYTLSSRNQWDCATCGHHFSLTSDTMLHGRKLPFRNYLFVLSLVLDRRQFASLLEFTRELGLNYKSVWEQQRKLSAAVGGASGCTVPFKLLSRAAWQLQRSYVRGVFQKIRTSDFQYPYLRPEQRAQDGADLVEFVNALVPHGLEDYIRADICQDMLLAILTGEASRDSVAHAPRAFISAVMQQSPWKYKWISFDQALPNGGSLHDLIADPRWQGDP